MKLAIIRQRYNPFGGAEQFIERAAGGLRAGGSSVTIVARAWQAADRVEDGVILCDPFYLGRLWRDASFARAVCRRLAHASFDLVQSHERLACCDIFRAGDGVHRQWLAHRAQVQSPLERFATQINPFHRYLLHAERRMFASERLRAVICNSKMVRADIRRYYDVADEKLHVIYNGVDLERFNPQLRSEHRSSVRSALGVTEDTPIYLFVGSGFARKGLPQLIRVFARHVSSGVLIVAGADRAARAMQQLAARSGCADRVRLLGGVRDVTPYYGAADFFVLPTLYDPFPNAVIEAMASGLPAIVSTQSGAAELIQTGVNGFACDPLDDEALGRALVDIRPLAGAAGRAAAREAVAHLSIDAMSRALLTLYRRLVAG